MRQDDQFTQSQEWSLGTNPGGLLLTGDFFDLIKDINDSLDDAKRLVQLLSNLSCKINLIPFNKFDGSNYERPSDDIIHAFKIFLINKGFITTLRTTRGDGVDAACGQLVGNLTKSIKGKKLISHKSL